MRKTQGDIRGFTVVEILLVFVAVGLIGIAGWAAYNHHRSTLTASSAVTAKTLSPTPRPTPSPNAYAGWQTCTDVSEGLSFKYPASWSTALSTSANPCNTSNVQAGDYFDLLSPQTSASPYVFQIQYFGDKQSLGHLDEDKGQTILSVTPLNVTGSKVPLSLIAFADNNPPNSPANIFEMALTDQSYKVRQVVDYVPDVTSQKPGGIAYSMTAILEAPGQQDIVGHSPAQYEAQPDYGNVIKIFESLSY
jgi:hypothetical protein